MCWRPLKEVQETKAASNSAIHFNLTLSFLQLCTVPSKIQRQTIDEGLFVYIYSNNDVHNRSSAVVSASSIYCIAALSSYRYHTAKTLSTINLIYKLNINQIQSAISFWIFSLYIKQFAVIVTRRFFYSAPVDHMIKDCIPLNFYICAQQ